MSKIGKMPIDIPASITIQKDGHTITVKGPKGTLQQDIRSEVDVVVDDNVITLSIKNEDHKNFWWLSRTLIANMIDGVVQWYEKKLIVIGVGYDAQVQWQLLKLSLWYSHPINYKLPEAITATTEKNPKWHVIVTLQSADKQLLGQVAADIRSKRPPEPYKGKGVRYSYEIVRLKAGKSAK